MGCCNDCIGIAVDPLVGAEPWRKSRLSSATGPTGPSGVAQDLSSPTGPVTAIVEGEWCCCPAFNIEASATMSDHYGGPAVINTTGAVTLWARCDQSVSRGAWATVERVTIPWPEEPSRFDGPNEFGNYFANWILPVQGFYYGLSGEMPEGYDDNPDPQHTPGPSRLLDDSVAINQLTFARDFTPVRFSAGYAIDGAKTTVVDVYSLEHYDGVSKFQIGVTSYANEEGIFRAGVRFGTFSQGFNLPHAATTGPASQFRTAVQIEGTPSTNKPLATVQQPTLIPEIDTNRSLCIPAEMVAPNPTGPLGSGPESVPAPAFRTIKRYSSGVYRFRPDFFRDRQEEFNDSFDSNCVIPDGPAWHENALVYGGTPLAVNGARHAMTVRFFVPPGVTFEIGEGPQLYRSHPSSPNVNIPNMRGIRFLPDGNDVFRVMGSISNAFINLSSRNGSRMLMPGQYAGFRNDMPSKSFSYSNEPPFVDVHATALGTQYFDVEYDVKPLLRIFAKTSVISSGLSYGSLPPGTTIESSGMTLKDFDFFSSGNWITAGDVIGGYVVFFVNVVARYTIKTIHIWKGRKVTYRNMGVRKLGCPLTVDQCKSLSNGETVVAYIQDRLDIDDDVGYRNVDLNKWTQNAYSVSLQLSIEP